MKRRRRPPATRASRRRPATRSGAVSPRVWIPVAVVLVTAAVFAAGLGNEFVLWDDDDNFTSNPHYRGLGWAQLRWMATSTHMGHYMPLTWLTLGVDYTLWGMASWGYHLTSLLLHALAALAFYFVAVRLLALARAAADDLAVRAGAAVAALVFAIHPLRAESVAWVTERRDVLSGVLFVSALLLYLRYVEAAPAARFWREPRYWATLGVFALALLSKSMTVTLPVLLILLDLYPLRRRTWMEKLPFFALAAIAGGLAIVSILRGAASFSTLERVTIVERLGLTAYSLAFYLWKTLVPWNLSPLYELPDPCRCSRGRSP